MLGRDGGRVEAEGEKGAFLGGKEGGGDCIMAAISPKLELMLCWSLLFCCSLDEGPTVMVVSGSWASN